jgi:hypothetical protein
MSSSGSPMAGAGLLFRNVGPETKALGFANAIDFPALWTCRQDDELVIDNQGFWFHRRCEELPEYRAIERLDRRKAKMARQVGCTAAHRNAALQYSVAREPAVACAV